MAWFIACLVLATGGFTALSLSRGQEPLRSEKHAPARFRSPRRSSSRIAAGSAPAPIAPRDLNKLSPLQQQMYLAAQRGADWLRTRNRPDGRFDYGYLPARQDPLEGDHYLRQAGAAFALARAAPASPATSAMPPSPARPCSPCCSTHTD